VSVSLPAVLLAAGGSTRMGRPKQLLPYRGQPLVRHAAETLVAAGFRPIFVVIGSEADAVRAVLEGLPIVIVRNDHWQRGIGSSLRCGIERAAQEWPPVPGVLVALADQPGVTVDHLRGLRAAWKSDHIAASHYAGAPAVPAIFPAALFEDLLRLPNDAGAKSVLQRYADRTALVPLEKHDDIDQPSDYERLLADHEERR